MRGQVLNAGNGSNDGLILGDDGRRYGFARAEWKAVGLPVPGVAVDYLAVEGAARDIYPLSAIGIATAPVAAIYPNNSSVLGGFGIGCLCLGFFFPVLVPLVGLVLGFVGAGTAKRYGDTGGLALSRIAWIGNLVLLFLQVIGVLLLLTIFSGLAIAILHQLATQGSVQA
jgi:hypothetical protein